MQADNARDDCSKHDAEKTFGNRSILGWMFHRLITTVGAVAMTLAVFLVLPLMQTISKPPELDMVIQSVDTANVPPPPAPPEPEPEQEPEPEEQPPELAETSPPLSIAQLEMALNPTMSGGWMAGDFTVKLNTIAGGSDNLDSLFSMAELDQKPRILYQPGPVLNAKIRKMAPGTVYIIFIVDTNGRVVKPIVQKSTDPVFNKPALAAVKQWKFEPGKRNGQPVRFRMRVPITFPKGR